MGTTRLETSMTDYLNRVDMERAISLAVSNLKEQEEEYLKECLRELIKYAVVQMKVGDIRTTQEGDGEVKISQEVLFEFNEKKRIRELQEEVDELKRKMKEYELILE